MSAIANEAFFDMLEELPRLFREVPHSILKEDYGEMLVKWSCSKSA